MPKINQQQVNNNFSSTEQKRKLNEKNENKQINNIIQLKGNDSTDSVLEMIAEIKRSNDEKVIKVSYKNLYMLKEIINPNSNVGNLQQMIDKYEIMRMLTHKNILKAHDILINDKKLPPSILFEYCPKNLEEEVISKKLTKVQKVYAIYQIAEGMKYVHSRKVVHLDLNPSNILVSDDGMIKIAGFEKSQTMKSMQQNKEFEMKEMEDVFSFGDMVYFILTDGGVAKIKNETVLNSLDLLANQMISACWSQIESRPTFEMICDVLETNNFNLISLSQQEANDLTRMINQYKSHF